ncbi:hypothetical protein MRB53_037898 [Persea americana]|nr:hypothetical protein MRB53_037898 [Persea americana]
MIEMEDLHDDVCRPPSIYTKFMAGIRKACRRYPSWAPLHAKSHRKKADFAKPKLRVGKPAAKAANHTSISFRAGAIHLPSSSLSATAPTVSASFTHNLSLLKHPSDRTRKEALAALANALQALPAGTSLPEPGAAVVLTKLQPLMLDASSGVRNGTLKLLRMVPPTDVEREVEGLLLYTRAALTHLSAEVRVSGVEALDWLVETCASAVVGCKGGWWKTFNVLLGLLGWSAAPTASSFATNAGLDGTHKSVQARDKSGWTSSGQTVTAKLGTNDKTIARQILVLGHFLAAGLTSKPAPSSAEQDAFAIMRPHLLPTKPNAFAHLNLFGILRDEESEMYDDVEERTRVWENNFKPQVRAGLERARKEGGELGRAAVEVWKSVGAWD